VSIVAPSPTSVYLYYDSHGILIYVGITSRGVRRQVEHNTSKDWWPFVVRQEVQHYPTRDAALKSERDLITRYLPPFNTQHNVKHSESRAAYMAFREATQGDWAERARSASMRLDLDVHSTDDFEHVVLRTKIGDSDIAQAIKPTDVAPRVIGLRKVGRVTDMEWAGPILLMHLSSTKRHPVTVPEAFLRFGEKSKHLEIKHLQLRLDHSDSSLCDKRCPQPRREVRWIRPDSTGRARV